uniref:Uncharacterized protein n=1 Tax=Physcomitrium patens TaxID=3218 RepID=A0A7I3ZW15_PHYPA
MSLTLPDSGIVFGSERLSTEYGTYSIAILLSSLLFVTFADTFLSWLVFFRLSSLWA